MTNAQLGKQFEGVIRKSFAKSERNLEVMKISDSTDQEVVSDLLVIGDANLYIEAKSTKADRFQFSQLKRHQIKSLAHLNNKRQNTHGVVLIEFFGYQVCYCFTIKDLGKLIKEGITSIHVDDETYQKYPIFLKDNGTYDLGSYYDMFTCEGE